ncbi:MAG: site-specific DNA-methyltransferase [Candidatus Omnitrophica bacterium]|nr:site-specific DNA-methyltransferase [Candidatus Omnitrophota bacterium]
MSNENKNLESPEQAQLLHTTEIEIVAKSLHHASTILFADEDKVADLFSIKEASEWATKYLKRKVTPSNISYLVQYGRVKKRIHNGTIFIQKQDLVRHYDSYCAKRKVETVQNIQTKIILGDCGQVLRTLHDNSIDLIVTSPPYADRRKNTYGGVKPEEYVEWFLPISEQLLRVLKPTGTFILNIKEKAETGERHTYVIELILALRKQGWLWTEEFIWHKKNCYPGKWPNRFRDAWEKLLQFNKTKIFHMYQEEVMVPIGEWANGRLRNLSDTDKLRDTSKSGSGFGKNISNWINRKTVYPTNVLHFATVCGNTNHSAPFPRELPEWFIKLFTKKGDWVLDPFLGSGTTAETAQRMERNSIGIEIVPEYLEIIKKKVQEKETIINR